MTIRGSLFNINSIISQLNKYEADTLRRIEMLAEKAATDIAMKASALFSNASVNVQPRGGFENAKVRISVTRQGDVMYVIAEGAEAVFIEFGTGVFFNGSAGSSPHPDGVALGMTIGNYGLGNGKKEAWAYTDENGDIVVTRGTPAAMPMYRSMRDVANNIYDIAKGVFQ